MSRSFLSHARVVCASASLLLVSGCMVGPDYKQPEIATAEDFVQKPVDQASWNNASEPEVAWWKSFNDPEMTRLIEDALLKNQRIEVARQNIIAARSLLRAEGFNLFPIVTANGSATKQKSSEAVLFPGAERTTETYSATLDAIWELDFFGGTRRSIEAFEADYQSLNYQYRDVVVTVAAEVANAYLQLRSAEYRLAVAKRNSVNQQETLNLTQILLDGGRGTQLDLERAKAQYQSTLATIPPLEAALAVSRNRLATLLGLQPSELIITPAPRLFLPEIPNNITVGDPESLLQRRPDVRAAERQLAASVAAVGVAKANLFPRVSFTGNTGYLSASIDDLSDSSNSTYSLGLSVSWAAFDFWRINAQVDARDAQSQAQLASYQRSVLLALEETDNALSNFAAARQALVYLAEAARASEAAADLARIRYRNGVESFISVLDAERRLLEAQDRFAVADTDAALATVALYKSLGGGWESAKLED